MNLRQQLESEIKRLGLVKSEILEDFGVQDYHSLVDKKGIADYNEAIENTTKFCEVLDKLVELEKEFEEISNKCTV